MYLFFGIPIGISFHLRCCCESRLDLQNAFDSWPRYSFFFEYSSRCGVFFKRKDELDRQVPQPHQVSFSFNKVIVTLATTYKVYPFESLALCNPSRFPKEATKKIFSGPKYTPLTLFYFPSNEKDKFEVLTGGAIKAYVSRSPFFDDGKRGHSDRQTVSNNPDRVQGFPESPSH